MRFPPECWQIHRTLRQRMPHLSEAQTKGLALRTRGTITAQIGCQNSVIAAPAFPGGFSAVRRRRRLRSRLRQPGGGRSGAEADSAGAAESRA